MKLDLLTSYYQIVEMEQVKQLLQSMQILLCEEFVLE